MILDANNKEDCQYEIFDANGNRLDYVVRADTETGQIERYIFDGCGKPSVDGYGDYLTETVFVPYPLKVIKHE